MRACNAQAEDKNGDERKAFMSSCLKGEATPMTQQEKMKKCNADAGRQVPQGRRPEGVHERVPQGGPQDLDSRQPGAMAASGKSPEEEGPPSRGRLLGLPKLAMLPSSSRC